MKIISVEKLPSTTNGWGFGGSVDKVKMTMENGDVWVSGTACYRHAPSSKWINLMQKEVAERHPDWTGSLYYDGVKDWDLKGKPETFIAKHYQKYAQVN